MAGGNTVSMVPLWLSPSDMLPGIHPHVVPLAHLVPKPCPDIYAAFSAW